MNLLRRFALGLLVVVALNEGCDRSPTPPAVPPVWGWDMSEDQATARVFWPARVTDDIWFIDGPVNLWLTLPNGRLAAHTFDSAQVRKNGKSVYVIALKFPPETFDQAYARVNRLADEWGASDREKLREFAAWRGNPPAGTYRPRSERLSADKAPVKIELRQSYVPDRPWYVTWLYGFPEHGPTFEPAAGSPPPPRP